MHLSVRRLWLPVVLYMAGIFALSSLTHPPSLPAGADKDVHGLLYAGLSTLVVRAASGGRWQGVTWGVAALAIVVSCAYGATDEFHQSFVPGRQSDVLDLVADTIGAAIAAVGLRLWAYRAASPH